MRRHVGLFVLWTALCVALAPGSGRADPRGDAPVSWFDAWTPIAARLAAQPLAALVLARDPYSARHVVAIRSASSNGKAGEASECRSLPSAMACATRAIAWTDTAGSTNPAEKWHYSSLAHLATSADGQPTSCTRVADDLPGAHCRVDLLRHAQGPKPRASTPREDACLDLAVQGACACQDNPRCRYPIPTSVQIDPRNGWVYATTESGLLVSVDGGRSWGRGPDSPVPALRPEATSAGTLPDGREPGRYPLPPSPVQLWTQDGADLNRTPWRIAAMGKLTLVFEPSGAPGANGRPQGTVAASMTVQWLTERGEPRADVFVARSEQRDGAGPLVFRATGR